MADKFKGKLFDSFRNPPPRRFNFINKPVPDRALPRNKEWNAHSGRRSRLRNLKNVCHGVLSSKDQELLAAVERLRELTKSEPEPEYGFLHLLFTAMNASLDTGVTITESIDYLIAKFAEARTLDSKGEE